MEKRLGINTRKLTIPIPIITVKTITTAGFVRLNAKLTARIPRRRNNPYSINTEKRASRIVECDEIKRIPASEEMKVGTAVAENIGSFRIVVDAPKVMEI